MKTIQVCASATYEVHMGSGLLSKLGQEAARVIPGRAAVIVSDDHVWPHYGQTALDSLQAAGFHTESLVLPSGEASKSAEHFLKLLEHYTKCNLQRNDCIVALGGGVVGDVAGFSAACYLRGIPYIQVPTTLLAMVDSSVGGKTAINLSAGKNLCGAFHQPKLVVCDTDTLHSLPENIFREGCAEVIKYAILFDEELFSHLEARGTDFDREWVISRCVQWKARVVRADEFDTGTRQLLNLGHTIGHAIEAASGHTVAHGRAVAAGIAMVTKYAAKIGICTDMDKNRILSLLEKFELPVTAAYTTDQLLPSVLRDKKAQAHCISMILPHSIGSCQAHSIALGEIPELLKAGL